MTHNSRPTLLEALRPAFRGRIENIAVEALGHILSTSEAARAALSDIVDKGGAPVGAIDRVETQHAGGGARPDLAGFDDSGRVRVLIEAKFEAGLAKTQPVAYLERLKRVPDAAPPSALLFVVPPARVESLWAELRRRVAEPTSSIEVGPFHEVGVVRRVDGGGGRRLMLTTWKALLDRMQARVSAGADSEAEADIRQLRGLADRESENVFRPLRDEEMRKDFPRLVRRLQSLAEDATEAAKGVGWVKDPKRKPQLWGDGRHLQLGVSKVWFGIHFDRWARVPTAPLWLLFPKDSLQEREKTRLALKPLRRKDPCELFDDDKGGLLVPVALPVEVGYEAVLKAVVTRLEEIAQVIGATSRRRGTNSKAQSRRLVEPTEKQLPLQREELRPDFPWRVVGLRRLVDDAVARGEGARWADTKKLNMTPRSWGYGRFLRLAGAEVWFGIHFDCWAQLPTATPLWLWFRASSRSHEKARRALEPLRRKDPGELFDDDKGGLLVPVGLPVEEEYDAVLEDVVKRLEEVAQLIIGPSTAKDPSLLQRIWKGIGRMRVR